MRRWSIPIAVAVGAAALAAPAHADSPSPAHPTMTGQVRLLHRSVTPRAASTAIRAYGVPTSNAGLGRITTAPNGDMWFVESDGYKIGRIKPSGHIDEWNLPVNGDCDDSTAAGCTHTDDPEVKDLDVDKSGQIWAIIDSGWKIGHINPSTSSMVEYSLGAYPYGEQIRMASNGTTPWFTLSYDEDGIGYIDGTGAHWPANAPACDGPLGRGTDGHMWCASFDSLIRVASDANSGLGAPLPDDATYPNSIAPGPSGAVWVGRDNQGTMFTSPGDGNIGWVNANTTSHFIRLGSRVAPRSLVRAGSRIWFTSVGAAKGIGHIDARGIGAVTKVGNYHPTSLTVGKDGAIWFTDDDHNLIVRVPSSALQTTNVNLGSGSQLRPASATRKVSLKIAAKGAKRAFTGKATSSYSACRAGKVQVRRVKGRSSTVVGRGKAGRSGAYSVRVPKARAKRGSYFVRILQTKPSGTVCKVADSPKRKIR